MGQRGRTPEEGKRGVTYTHDKCNDGKQRRGWLAGDVHVLLCHVGKGKSQPCERELLGTNHRCPGCMEQRALEDIGYVPLRREDGRPVCVLVRKATIPFVAKIKPGTSVLYGRASDQFEGVYVITSPKQVPWSHYYDYKPDDDMSYWLPLFLKTPHLAPVMRELFQVSECQPVVTEPVPAPVEERMRPATLPAPTEARPVAGDKVVTEEMVQADIDRLKEKWKTLGISANGKK